MRPLILSFAAIAISVPVIAASVFCSDMLRNPHYWGRYNWDLFHDLSNYRSVVEFGEPLWNPWYRGGFPMVGNPPETSFDPGS